MGKIAHLALTAAIPGTHGGRYPSSVTVICSLLAVSAMRPRRGRGRGVLGEPRTYDSGDASLAAAAPSPAAAAPVAVPSPVAVATAAAAWGAASACR